MRNSVPTKSALLWCLFVLLTVCLNAAEKDAKSAAAPKPKPTSEPTQKKSTAQPAPSTPAPPKKPYKFSDHVKTRAEVFTWLQNNMDKLVKDPFETTEQFNARTAGYRPPDPIIMELDSTYEYDADSENLVVRTSKFSNDVFLPQNVIYSDNWPYVKQSVLVINSTNASAFSKHITNGVLEQSFKVAPQEARSLAKNMKLALQISFTEFKCTRKQIKNPTHDGTPKTDQVPPIVEVFTVEGKIEHLSAYDGDTGTLKSDEEFE